MVLTIEELSEYLKVSKEKIYRMLQSNEIPAFKIGSQWRFKLSEIEKWIDSHMINTTSFSDQKEVCE